MLKGVNTIYDVEGFYPKCTKVSIAVHLGGRDVYKRDEYKRNLSWR